MSRLNTPSSTGANDRNTLGLVKTDTLIGWMVFEVTNQRYQNSEEHDQGIRLLLCTKAKHEIENTKKHKNSINSIKKCDRSPYSDCSRQTA